MGRNSTATIRSFSLFSLILFLLAQRSYEYNILGLFPHFGFSHFKVFYPVLHGLAERGHNVTVISYTKGFDLHPNYNELLLKSRETVNVFTLDRFSPSRSLKALLFEYFTLHNEGQQSCEDFYQSGYIEEIIRRHRSNQFDLVLMEYFNTDCYLGVPYVLNLPVVGFSSCALMPWYYDRIALPDTPSYVQTEFIGFPEELSWHERLLNFVQSRLIKLLYRFHTNSKDNKIIRKYLNVDVNVDEFAKNRTSLIFVNQHYSLSGSRPQTPQLIEMGGIHLNEREMKAKLPNNLQEFLLSAPNGVLFISWGSMLRAASMPKAKLERILKVLRKFPLKIVWKWEEDAIPIEEGDQFMFVKWAPQLTLLCHDKVKLFWGHGGLLGVTEAVNCAKPMILTPIYGDHFLNGHAVQNRGVGEILYYSEIDDVNQLRRVLEKVMEASYTNNARTLSNIFRNRQISPLNTTLWWIEHLLKHTPETELLLRTKAVYLPWFIYYSVDSVALLLLVVIVPFALLWKTIRCMAPIRRGRKELVNRVLVLLVEDRSVVVAGDGVVDPILGVASVFCAVIAIFVVNRTRFLRSPLPTNKPAIPPKTCC